MVSLNHFNYTNKFVASLNHWIYIYLEGLASLTTGFTPTEVLASLTTVITPTVVLASPNDWICIYQEGLASLNHWNYICLEGLASLNHWIYIYLEGLASLTTSKNKIPTVKNNQF